MGSVISDVRHALRSLRKDPGFTTVAVLTLALGIGANTGIFSVVNAVLLRPLPYAEPDRLVELFTQGRDAGSRFSLAYPDLLEIRGLSRDFAAVAPYATQLYNFTSGGEPREVRAALATDDLFRVLRAEAAVGRTFTPSELREQAVILGYGLWSSEFGSDRAVVGRSITLDGRPFTVVGIMPPGFHFPDEDTQIWVPLGLRFLTDPSLETDRNFYAFNAVARLAPGATLEQAEADLGVVAQRINAAQRDQSQGQQRLEISMQGRGPGGGPRTTIIPQTQFQVVPLLENVLQDRPRALWVLFGAVGLVLLIACANVAALLVARGTARRKEIAVRQAIGAGRWPIARQLLIESVVLAVMGGLVGVGLSYWGVDALLALWPDVLPRSQEIDVDGRVLAFAFGLSVLTGLISGVVPALRATVFGVEQTLRDESGASTGARSRRRINSVLVTGELAIALVLLVGSGLLIKSFLRLTSVDLGYDTREVLAARIRLTPSRYATPQAQVEFFQRLSDQLAQNPGVAQASLSRTLPLTGGVQILAFDPRKVRPDYPEPFLASRMSVVAPGYFAALGIPLRLGRDISAADRADAPPVAVINTQLANIMWPGQDPLGKTIPVGFPGRPPQAISVIGVIGDVHYASFDAPVMPELYLPYTQSPQGNGTMWVALRARTSPIQLAGGLRDAVRQLDQEQPIGEIASLDQMASRRTATRRFNMTLLTGFAGLALVLALVGIYGLTAYTVTQRNREMGLRMAIGARPGEVVNLLLRENLWLVLIGTAVGIVGALAGTRVLKSLVFEVSTMDLVTFLASAVVLGLVAMAATYLPARRAARIHPIEALRYE
jgi:putative ABC transport system permease protein